MSMKGENAVRRKVMIDNEAFYLVIGKNFAHSTTPYENRPENEKVRRIVDTICEEITRVQGGDVEETT